MADTNTPEIDPDLDDAVAANRALHQGLGLGARELNSQEDPEGSGAGTPDVRTISPKAVYAALADRKA